MGELARTLSTEGVQRAYVDGGQLISACLKAGLIDEMTINIIPRILGTGRRLFDGTLPEVPLRQTGVRGFASGLVQVQYAI